LGKAARKWQVPNNKLPTVSSDIPKDLRFFIDRVAEIVNNSGPDQFLTLADLKKGAYNEAINDSGAVEVDGDDVVIPVFCPPKATNLVATGGYEYVILDWDRPTYYGHALTRVYRAFGASPQFSEAEAVTEVEGRAGVFSDYLGTGGTATYWVQFVNINGEDCGVISDPATATTAINVEEVLEVLENSLTSTQFVNDLSTFEDGGAPYLINALNSFVVKLAGEDGAAAGFGLASTEREGNVEFDFAVLADNFFITPPVDFNQSNTPSSPAQGAVWRDTTNPNSVVYKLYEGAEWVEINPSPFIVRTTPTTITNADGVDIDVPSGVYIRDGYIQNGTITNAKIGTAAIDNAKIVDATITDAKIGYLDAGKIQTGEFQSFDFSNEEGKAGFRLAMSTRPVFDAVTGEFTGEVEFLPETNQDDIEFILRGANDPKPALQLIGGEVTINALNIREQLKSADWPTKGFLFDVETGVIQFKDDDGTITFSTNGYNGTAIQDALDAAIGDLNDEIDLQTPLTTFKSLLDIVNDETTGLATKASATALGDFEESTDESLDTLNTSLDAVRDPETGLLDPEKISVNIISNDAQLLSDLEFLRPFALEAELDLFFNKAAFAQLIAGTLIADQLFVNTGNFDEVLTDRVLANDGTIENLKVKTLQIADEAVFVPVSGSTNQGQSIGTGWVKVAESTPITWNSNAEKPKSVIVSGSMNFLASISSSDGGGCSIKVGVEYPIGNANFGDGVAVSTRIDYSQVVSTVSRIELAAGSYTSVTAVLYARTSRYGSSNPSGHTVGGGSVVGFAGKSGAT
jgi:hypothetical protein